MKRSPIKRKTRLRARRPTVRRDGRVRDEAYLAFVRSLPCCVVDDKHGGRIDPHHAGERPAGRKADDDTCIPMCRYHHDQWDGPMWHGNPFRTWDHEKRRAWQDERIAETRALWEKRNSYTDVVPF